MRAVTTTAAPVVLTTDGGAFSFGNQLRLPDDSSFVVNGLIVARDIATGDSRSWRLSDGDPKFGRGTTVVFAPVITDIGISSGATSWGVSVARIPTTARSA